VAVLNIKDLGFVAARQEQYSPIGQYAVTVQYQHFDFTRSFEQVL
jgi:hypothetical protein